jgi:hypothetical protein
MMLQGQNCNVILKVWLQKMICRDLLSAEDPCNENPVMVVDLSDVNEESARVSATDDVRLNFKVVHIDCCFIKFSLTLKGIFRVL